MGIAALGWCFGWFAAEPVYQGHSLEYYLAALTADGYGLKRHAPFDGEVIASPSAERARAWAALPRFGTNALPRMLHWLRADDGFLERKLIAWDQRQAVARLPFLPAEQKRAAAVSAFLALGNRARAATPALLPLLTNRVFARPALYALTWIHPDQEQAVPALTNAVRFWSNSMIAMEAIAALGSLGPKAAKAIPLLRESLQSAGPMCRAMAAVALARIGAPADEVVPLIRRDLERADPAGLRLPAQDYVMDLWALKQFGRASPGVVLAQLPALMTNAHVRIRSGARRLFHQLGNTTDPRADRPSTP
jgi:HEAT repeats